jgi:hypothetical protein
MRIKTPYLALSIGLSSSCLGSSSDFAFHLTGDVEKTVQSDNSANGEVDDAGHFAIDDETWGLRISLGGLASGDHKVTGGNASSELLIMSKDTGDTFGTANGGSCDAWIDPHASTNGSTVSGWFTCNGLLSTAGKHVDVVGGRFTTVIDDAANDPTSAPPTR